MLGELVWILFVCLLFGKYFLNSALSAATQISLRQRMLRLNLGPFQSLHWHLQSDALKHSTRSPPHFNSLKKINCLVSMSLQQFFYLYISPVEEEGAVCTGRHEPVRDAAAAGGRNLRLCRPRPEGRHRGEGGFQRVDTGEKVGFRGSTPGRRWVSEGWHRGEGRFQRADTREKVGFRGSTPGRRWVSEGWHRGEGRFQRVDTGEKVGFRGLTPGRR